MSSAKITIWNKVVGYLVWDEPNQTAIFEADDDYLVAPFNIAPLIHGDKNAPLTGINFSPKFNGLPPCFNDALPDSFGNNVFKEWLEQNKIDQSELNPVERLLYIGQRGIGALEYHIGRDIPNITHIIDVNDLAAISDKIIKRKYDQRDYILNPEALKNILVIGSSVGGAQAKILVAINKKNELLAGDILHAEPVDYYIIKLEHDSSDIWLKEKNVVEFEYNQMAREAGLFVSESKLFHIDGKTHFASKRFDRVNNHKIHTQTVNALTGFYGRNTEFSYEEIFRIIEYLRLPYVNLEQLFIQLVFNVAASNRDDHTKNFSFVMNDKAEWSLSPSYDLTYPFDPYQNFNVPHQIAINGKTSNITRKDLETVAKKAGIRGYNKIIDRVVESVASFTKRIKPYDLNKNTVKLISKDLELNRKRLEK